ncbi:MAG: hypothetical protein SFW62_02270 [Alphaproteobacteria bacterium]|nr:hypothetical protein [Alphaproteobacteria bacterium]
MLTYDPIDCVDYIFDRYAFLGINADASKDEIEKAIRTKRVGLHPDRITGADKKLKMQADWMRESTDSCAAMLLNDQLRPLYDEKLAWFKENKPKFVSLDGTKIVDLFSPKLLIDVLLDKDEPDLGKTVASIKQMTGYSPKAFDFARKLYEQSPDDPDCRDAYRDALNAKWTYLCLMEDVAWAKAGVAASPMGKGGPLLAVEGYTEAVEGEIQSYHDGIGEAVVTRSQAVQIGTAKPPLLLADLRNGEFLPALGVGISDEDQARLVVEAQRIFSDRVGAIRDLAQQKQEILKLLVDLTKTEDLGVPLDITKPYDLHCMRVTEESEEEPIRFLSFEAHPSGVIEVHRDNASMGALTVAQLKEMGSQGCVIFCNKEIHEFVLETQFAAEKHFLPHLNQAAQPEKRPTRPRKSATRTAPSKKVEPKG